MEKDKLPANLQGRTNRVCFGQSVTIVGNGGSVPAPLIRCILSIEKVSLVTAIQSVTSLIPFYISFDREHGEGSPACEPAELHLWREC